MERVLSGLRFRAPVSEAFSGVGNGAACGSEKKKIGRFPQKIRPREKRR